jgi:hypothetical protein
MALAFQSHWMRKIRRLNLRSFAPCQSPILADRPIRHAYDRGP